MSSEFPAAVPELRVGDVKQAAQYYQECLGFTWDWGTAGIAQVSRGDCRLFLTDDAFRDEHEGRAPTVIWLNLSSKAEVDRLHEAWKARSARIQSPPESKPWNLHEFVAQDPDGNRLRVFYDFAWELRDK